MGGGGRGGEDEDATSGITLQQPSKSRGSICRPRASLDHLKGKLNWETFSAPEASTAIVSCQWCLLFTEKKTDFSFFNSKERNQISTYPRCRQDFRPYLHFDKTNAASHRRTRPAGT